MNAKKRMLHKNLIPAIILFLSTLFVGCSDDDSEDELLGNWLKSSTFDGIPRSSCVSFVINNKGYVGTGYDGTNYLNDFWEYNIEEGFWIQKADFPGVKRSFATGFSIGSNGYIGTGFDGFTQLYDYYKYDSQTNTWNQIADFAEGNPRTSAIAFSSDTNGYVGCGYDGINDKKDFWKYDPTLDSWTQIFGFGGEKRRNGTAFRINNYAYIGTGKSNGVNITDFWKINLDNDNWTKLTSLTDNDDYSIVRSNAVSFALGNYGYICQGTSNGTTWEYNPTNDQWTKKTTFEGINRQDAVAFSNGDRAFVLLGRSSNLYLDDMFEFKPFDTQEDDD